MSRLLRDVGEHPWIATLTRRLARRSSDRRVLIGIGDDAAVLRLGRRPLVLTTDTLIDGVHFERAWLSAADLGRRAFRVNASDVAAMGAVPVAAVLGLEAPGALRVRDLDAMVGALAADARAAGASLVGGNMAAGPHLALTVTLLGEVPGRIVTRAGARPGDDVWITGPLGATGAAVQALRAGRRIRLPALPQRAALAPALARVAHAMIDVSDGLVQDLGHVCRASGVGADIDLPVVPIAPACRLLLGDDGARFAVTAGEDYELLVVAPPRAARALARLRPKPTRIGRIVRGRARVRALDADGRAVPLAHTGWDHWR